MKQTGSHLTLEAGLLPPPRHVASTFSQRSSLLGDLVRVDKIVKVLVFVASAPDFYQQPAVMHGFSDLMVQVFGERGKHARSAIGTNVLPNNQPVEIEMIVQIRE